MDPNATLARIRELILQFDNEVDDSEAALIATDALSSFGFLDSWLTNGGFLPEAWQSNA